MKTTMMAAALLIAAAPALGHAADATAGGPAATWQTAQAQPSGGAAPQVSAQDQEFARKAAASGLAEVAAAGLAKDHAQANDVRDFAQQMINDHSAVNQQLAQVAQQLGISLPTQTDEAHQREAQELAKLSGAQFDRAYMQGQIRDHEEAVSLFRTEAESGSNPQLRQLAQTALPKLEQHLDRARRITASL